MTTEENSKNSVDDAFRAGSIEVICGSMFSGKTEELIRRMKRAKIAKMKAILFKHIKDDRYHKENVVSHDQTSFPAHPVSSMTEILYQIGDAQVIGIDEAQFFEEGITDVCNKLADDGKRIIIAGLDTDFQRKPFGPMPALMAIAENVFKSHAICANCQGSSNFSYRTTCDTELVVVGDTYLPLCRKCYTGERSVVNKELAKVSTV